VYLTSTSVTLPGQDQRVGFHVRVLLEQEQECLQHVLRHGVHVLHPPCAAATTIHRKKTKSCSHRLIDVHKVGSFVPGPGVGLESLKSAFVRHEARALLVEGAQERGRAGSALKPYDSRIRVGRGAL
jgi:hypothetical protein